MIKQLIEKYEGELWKANTTLVVFVGKNQDDPTYVAQKSKVRLLQELLIDLHSLNVPFMKVPVLVRQCYNPSPYSEGPSTPYQVHRQDAYHGLFKSVQGFVKEKVMDNGVGVLSLEVLVDAAQWEEVSEKRVQGMREWLDKNNRGV